MMLANWGLAAVFWKNLAQIAGAHYECLDGNGYPNGLIEHKTPLETRMITEADIFDSISAELTYHPANSIEKTLGIMQNMEDTAIVRQCFESLIVVMNPEWVSLLDADLGVMPLEQQHLFKKVISETES